MLGALVERVRNFWSASPTLDVDSRSAISSASAWSAGSVVRRLSRSRDVIDPIWRMPRPNSSRAASGARLASIAASSASTDLSCQPSRRAALAVGGEAEDVGGLGDPAEIEKLDQRLLAQPLDIERAAADEMRSRSSRCAGQISPPVQRTSTSPSSATASESQRGQWSGRSRGAVLVAGEILDDLRDHVAGALEDDAVAGAHAEPRDLVGIVQRRIGDHDAADRHRF
jgi:hypothetical protein